MEQYIAYTQWFAVGVVAAELEVTCLVCCYSTVPVSLGLFKIGVVEYVEIAAVSLAAAEQYTAVGQFFALGLIAIGCRAVVEIVAKLAKQVPGFSEVVGV